MVLAVSEEGRVPVDVEGVKMLQNVLKGHPEHVGHVFVGGPGRVDAEARRGADAGPYEAVAPGVFYEEEAVVAVSFEVKDGVVVFSDQAEGFLFLGGDVAGSQGDDGAALVKCLFDPVPCFIKLDILAVAV